MKQFGTWSAFLAAPFAVVALIGLFATFAVQLPWQRAAGWDAAAIAVLGGDEAARARLPEEARSRPAAELPALAVAWRDRQLQEAAATAGRLRLLLLAGTLAAFGFGLFVLRSAAGPGRVDG
jgi:hypothetical protein